MLKRSIGIILLMMMFLSIFNISNPLYTALHKIWLQHIYNGYTPGQIVQAYHDAYIDKDTNTICLLAQSGTTQSNIPELTDNGILIFMWVDSITTSQIKTYVYSTFKYGAINFDMEHMITCVRIREALYYKDGIWQVGLGNIIDIGCLNRIKNVDYINIGV